MTPHTPSDNIILSGSWTVHQANGPGPLLRASCQRRRREFSRGIVGSADYGSSICRPPYALLLLDVDGQHVRRDAAPALPKPYNDAIDGLCIGPKAGSRGTAMYRRERVVVTDILEDPLWEAYREVAKPYGLRACWSTPILAHSGEVLGSFAMYYREPRGPSPSENRALEMATHIAGIAIERKLTHERLQAK